MYKMETQKLLQEAHAPVAQVPYGAEANSLSQVDTDGHHESKLARNRGMLGQDYLVSVLNVGE